MYIHRRRTVLLQKARHKWRGAGAGGCPCDGRRGVAGAVLVDFHARLPGPIQGAAAVLAVEGAAATQAANLGGAVRVTRRDGEARVLERVLPNLAELEQLPGRPVGQHAKVGAIAVGRVDEVALELAPTAQGR